MPSKEDPKEVQSIQKADKTQLSERVKQYLVRAHSFEEVGTETHPELHYDILHFPHLLFAMGVIVAVYGYYITLISTEFSAQIDGIIALVGGDIVATIGLIFLIKKYRGPFFTLLILATLIVLAMLVIWDFVLVPLAESTGVPVPALKGDLRGDFFTRYYTVLLTVLTFAYTACLIWFIFARYTSSFYFSLFTRGKDTQNRLFLVDPWRKVVSSKAGLISDIAKRSGFPFLFLFTILNMLTEQKDLFFIELTLGSYFQGVLLMFFLLCGMVVLFPAFWLLDYVRHYDEERLEVHSLGAQVKGLVEGYAGISAIITFIASTQGGVLLAVMQFFVLSMYLFPTLIVLIGGYVLLTERDVFYIAGQVMHGRVIICDFRLVDSDGRELKWWLGEKATEEPERGKCE